MLFVRTDATTGTKTPRSAGRVLATWAERLFASADVAIRLEFHHFPILKDSVLACVFVKCLEVVVLYSIFDQNVTV